eukprot:scaffold33339_cov54-Phaeocystis_antarctica.AAC.1
MVRDSRVRAAALPPPSAPPSCAGQPRAMPWQASSRRTVKSTMASRVGSSCRGVNEAMISLITWRQFGREGGSRGLQGRLIGWCNSRNRGLVPCRSHSPQIDPLCRACTACYARLEDRPLGVWVEEGLKEEIAGGRGPRRPSQHPGERKFSLSRPVITAGGCSPKLGGGSLENLQITVLSSWSPTARAV